MSDKYNKDLEQKKPMQDLFMITGKVGKKDTAWVHISDINYFNTLRKDLDLLLGDRKAKGGMGKELLDKIVKCGSGSEVGNDYKMIQNSELIVDGIPVINLLVVDEVVQKFNLVHKIYRGELTEEQERYFKVGALKFINGELILDEEKYNIAMMAVL